MKWSADERKLESSRDCGNVGTLSLMPKSLLCVCVSQSHLRESAICVCVCVCLRVISGSTETKGSLRTSGKKTRQAFFLFVYPHTPVILCSIYRMHRLQKSMGESWFSLWPWRIFKTVEYIWWVTSILYHTSMKFVSITFLLIQSVAFKAHK